jgi:hypothetical protein
MKVEQGVSLAEWQRACEESQRRSLERRSKPASTIIAWVLFAWTGMLLGVAIGLVWLYEAGKL